MKKILLLLAAFCVGISTNSQTLEEAKKAIEVNNTGTAERTLEKVIQNEPSNHEAYYLISKLYLKKGNFDDCLVMINKAIDLNQNNSDYRWVKVRASLRSNSSENDLKTAIDELNFIINNSGSSSKAFATLGFTYYEYANKFTEAPKMNSIKSNNDILDRPNNNIKEVYNEGIKLFELAKLNYKKAIELDKEKAEDYGYKIKEADTYITTLKSK
ncbi:tetratricopeptide repeat protein [Flavobacterium sp.]|uniref:tetratricopeptide repeat protein n=1 Tax=Flavobacterium sp. TaxID=239 RepID=UPI0026017D83|nr:tetratricopeptide repeat protein [Flavobacterium sp.]